MRVTRWLPVVLLGILLAILGQGLLWTTMMVYDDEGYVLYSLRAFAENGGLYEKVFSQYGPFFFLWNRVLGFAGFDYSNTGARIVTLGYWLITMSACGALVARVTRSAVATAATMAGVFFHLWTMISEPSHPGGMICAIIAVVAWLGTDERLPERWRALVIGSAGAALALTKVNVGAFLLVASTGWWVLASADFGRSTAVRIGVAAALAALPFAVMHHLVASAPWVATFAAIVSCAAVAVVLVTPRGADAVRMSTITAGIAAGIVVVVATALAIRATGTSWTAMLDGVILGPLRHPGAYSSAVRWRPLALPVALVSLALLGLLARQPAERRFVWVAIVRIVSAAAFLLVWSNVLPLDPHAFSLSYGVAATAWFVIPLRNDDRAAMVRAWLGILAVTQSLHAFPVAGSQISWGTFLWIPLAAIGVHDALAAAVTRNAGRSVRLAAGTIAAAGLALVCFNCYRYGQIVWERYRDSDALRLPGAAGLHLPHHHSTTLRVLALNAVVHADPLFSLPGMLSFHGWTGVPPPTTLNATHWFTLLKPEQQREIQAALERSPRACVIVQRDVYGFLQRTGVATESELTKWLHANFEAAFALETFDFWVRRGRSIAPVSTAVAREAATGASPRYLIQATLADERARNITSVVLLQFVGAGAQERQRWDASNASVTLTPLTSGNAPRGQTQAAAWPFSASELMRVELYTDEFPRDFPTASGLLQFRNADGDVVAEARLLP